MMDDYKDILVNEEDAIKLYKQLGIDVCIPLDIDRLGREYQEAFAVLERDDYCTFAFVNDTLGTVNK